MLLLIVCATVLGLSVCAFLQYVLYRTLSERIKLMNEEVVYLKDEVRGMRGRTSDRSEFEAFHTHPSDERISAAK